MLAESAHLEIEFHASSESGSNLSGQDVEATALNSKLVLQ